MGNEIAKPTWKLKFKISRNDITWPFIVATKMDKNIGLITRVVSQTLMEYKCEFEAFAIRILPAITPKK